MSKDVVIFLHGRGQGPETAGMVASAFPGAELLAPSGGVELRQGRTWFQNRQIGIAEPESVKTAEVHFLHWLEEQGIADQNIWLCGFSNGGAFAGHLLLHFPQRFAGAALLSAPLVLPPWPKGRLVGKAVFYGHGDATDSVVSQIFFETAEEYLAHGSGCSLSVGRYAAEHVIPDEMVRDVGEWFDGVRSSRAVSTSMRNEAGKNEEHKV
jgi:phospholipase/carboxylesterase